MLVNSKKIIKLLEDRFPTRLAASWDNVGFQVGNLNSTVNKILVALEITPEVIQEAVDVNADLIVCHHPLIFEPLKSLTESSPVEAMLRKLTASRIGVYVAHTNADAAPGGTVDALLEALGLERSEIMGEVFKEPFFKLAVYVPEHDTEAVAKAMFESGAGHLGAYAECSFSAQGTGTFLPLEGAKPAIGAVNVREQVAERKLEVLVPQQAVRAVVKAMLETHPYEVPAYDLWPLKAPEQVYGFGAVASIPHTEAGGQNWVLMDWARHVRNALKAPGTRMIGSPEALIHRVAVVPGAGGSFYREAAQAGCDLLITGDVKYHDAQGALALGLHLIDAGHFETELPFVSRLAAQLSEELEQKGYEARVVISKASINPFSIDF
ncbi:Nif3-like dinuclear metal center hexameric protein [Acidaminobacter hydrogenoformans]|uniref:GTP cyclohydrolase 1 type 2 homolog n=1 Tax=Acidaminobacter hydrogenoformans DSM 2784 TaxID=1120920 RepID=A0A1G5RUL9_9FIRM|nr:Nif3-like dinuclear metal center hexameric protein [Acidaminobacter hydrogenoformans]SCZ77141.1 dinuclear metal center protein, YbgI/SA1388 family [Acidaminobacter hydrogenoformans DSM 2784]